MAKFKELDVVLVKGAVVGVIEKRNEYAVEFVLDDGSTRGVLIVPDHLLATKDTEVARLREALEFYADPNSYVQEIIESPMPFGGGGTVYSPGPHPIMDDRGEIARKALEGTGGSE